MHRKSSRIHTHTHTTGVKKFNKMVGNKINTQESVIFLYTRNEQPENEI